MEALGPVDTGWEGCLSHTWPNYGKSGTHCTALSSLPPCTAGWRQHRKAWICNHSHNANKSTSHQKPCKTWGTRRAEDRTILTGDFQEWKQTSWNEIRPKRECLVAIWGELFSPTVRLGMGEQPRKETRMFSQVTNSTLLFCTLQVSTALT